ncbi:MAG: DUF192 domain-containing protein [Candidatus Micrarchaeota archaeon]|nr:DUF192 domain-containing protein [Candidatus Micrarchaeota archaeon]
MIIRNKTKGTIIATDVEEAVSIASKAKGLMGRSAISDNYAMLFDFGKDKKEGFWMLFMKIPIDIVFIDSSMIVVDIKHSVKPITFNPQTWKIYHPKKPARYVIELKSGTAKHIDMSIGDTIEIKKK